MFQDGFGQRTLAIDQDTGEPVEMLAFTPALVNAPNFGAAVAERVARLSRVRHTHYARARRVDRPSETSLVLVSDAVPGWRLSDVLATLERKRWPIDISAVLVLLRQLIPAVALFSRHQRDATIGTLAPERLILTPEGRLVVAEFVLAPGLEQLQASRDRLWREFRVTVPHGHTPARLSPRTDVLGLGIVSLSLLLSRPLKDDEFLVSLGDLVGSLREQTEAGSRPLSPALASWLTRALQFDDSTAFASPQEAQVAFEEVLAVERSYVTTPVQLDQFVQKYRRVAGRPPQVDTSGATPRAAGGDAAAAEPTDRTDGARAADPDDAPRAGRRSGGRWLWAALILMTLVALAEGVVITWLTQGTAPLGNRGELVIHSRPIAARVTIDGEHVGITPYSTRLSAGAHVVEVQVGRSEPRVIPVLIRPGVQSGLYVELQRVATVGGLDVRTDPPGARVLVAGQYVGDTPLVVGELPPGDVEVRIQAGGREVRHTVRIEPGVTSQLVVPMSQ